MTEIEQILSELADLRKRVEVLESNFGKSSRFCKPTIEQITEYCNEITANIAPAAFFDYYEGNGWRVGKNTMKNWKAAVRTWVRNNKNNQPKSIYDGEKQAVSNGRIVSMPAELPKVPGSYLPLKMQ